MALHLKTEAYGLDLYIKRFQTDLYNQLAKVFPVGFVHESYGCCNRNFVNGKYHVELFNQATTMDYIDVLWDDTKGMVSFFGIDTKMKKSTRDPMNVHWIAFINLKKAKPTAIGRPDEDIKVDVRNIIGKCLYGFHYTSVETGIHNVLKEYPGSIEQAKTYDQHPVHAFRINFVVHYNKNFSTTLKLS